MSAFPDSSTRMALASPVTCTSSTWTSPNQPFFSATRYGNEKVVAGPGKAILILAADADRASRPTMKLAKQTASRGMEKRVRKQQGNIDHPPNWCEPTLSHPIRITSCQVRTAQSGRPVQGSIRMGLYGSTKLLMFPTGASLIDTSKNSRK